MNYCLFAILNIDTTLRLAIQASALQIVTVATMGLLLTAYLVNACGIIDIDDGEIGRQIDQTICWLQVLREGLELATLFQHEAIAFDNIDILLGLSAVVVE